MYYFSYFLVFIVCIFIWQTKKCVNDKIFLTEDRLRVSGRLKEAERNRALTLDPMLILSTIIKKINNLV